MEEKTEEKAVRVSLKPLEENGIITALTTTVTVEDANYEGGEEFDSLPLSLASCRTANYGLSDIQAADGSGIVPLQTESTVGAYGPAVSYRFGRSVRGRLTVTYTARTMPHDPTKGDPGFSLFQHQGGMTGAGLVFLLLPKETEQYHYYLTYDLSGLKNPGHCVCGYGEGDVDKVCTGQELKEVFFCIGAPYEYHQEGSKLHIVWLSGDIRFVDEFCQATGRYFDYMEKLFHDDDLPYFIILYPTTRTDLTGTALRRCCYMGLGDRRISSVKEVEGVLTHELVHNWVAVFGEEYLSSLHAEGNAEYYSMYAQYHSGAVTLADYVESANEKLKSFYSNPYCEADYRTAYDRSWTHAYAQRVPYGRGLIMLMQLDSCIRSESNGKKSLNDVTLALIDQEKTGDVPTWEKFTALCEDLSNGRAKEIIRLAAGEGAMVPPEDFFGPEYVLTKTEVLQEDTGFDETVRFQDPKIITGLREGTNAAKAGLRNGDEIVTNYSEELASRSEQGVIEFDIKRGGEVIPVKYVPRGEPVVCWQYVKRAARK